MTENEQRNTAEAWDRVGRYMENVAAVGGRMAQRNLAVWKAVSERLGQGPVTTDTLAENTAQMVVAAQETMEDLWSSMVQPASTEPYVQVLPTAFLFFDWLPDQGTHTLLDPVHIPVTLDRLRKLPEEAKIALNGTATRPRPGDTDLDEEQRARIAARGLDLDAEGSRLLTERLRAGLESRSRSYLLETVNAGETETYRLIPGVYDGLVYLVKPALPLANVRVIVDGPPPEV